MFLGVSFLIKNKHVEYDVFDTDSGRYFCGGTFSLLIPFKIGVGIPRAISSSSSNDFSLYASHQTRQKNTS